MKENWTYKKLGDVCQVVTGSTPKTNIPEYWGGKYPWITPAELKGDTYIKDTERHITDKAVAHTNLTLMPIGTVLLSSRAPIGKVAITETEMYCNQGFKNLICSDEINNKYLFLWLKGQTDYLNSLGRGATFKEISKNIVENIQIPLPPLSIQQSIVAELDEINNLLQLKKKELEIFDKLAQSIFYEMFGDPVTNEKGWEVKNFGEIGTFLRGKNIQKSDFVKEGMPCIHYGQVHTKFGKMIYSHLTEIPKSVYDKSIIASKGDIIIAITSEDLAGSCKSTAWLGNYDVAVSAHAAVFNHSENPLYIVYYINSSRFKAEKEKYARGFKVMEIKTKDIAKIPITLPPLALQNEFANRIQAIEQQKEQVKASINKLETLLASRMQYWFD